MSQQAVLHTGELHRASEKAVVEATLGRRPGVVDVASKKGLEEFEERATVIEPALLESLRRAVVWVITPSLYELLKALILQAFKRGLDICGHC